MVGGFTDAACYGDTLSAFEACLLRVVFFQADCAAGRCLACALHVVVSSAAVVAELVGRPYRHVDGEAAFGFNAGEGAGGEVCGVGANDELVW